MLSRLLRRSPVSRRATALYGAIMTEARAPALYADLGVPDTVSGRFEMLVLHLFLVLKRLQPEGEDANAVGQAVFDTFCSDMDRSLRTLGIGDLGVPRRMKEVGEAFYGRSQAYDNAVGRHDVEALAAALARNAYKKPDDPSIAMSLARYALAAAEALQAATVAEIIDAEKLPLPDPAGFAGAGAGALA